MICPVSYSEGEGRFFNWVRIFVCYYSFAYYLYFSNINYRYFIPSPYPSNTPAYSCVHSNYAC